MCVLLCLPCSQKTSYDPSKDFNLTESNFKYRRKFNYIALLNLFVEELSQFHVFWMRELFRLTASFIARHQKSVRRLYAKTPFPLTRKLYLTVAYKSRERAGRAHKSILFARSFLPGILIIDGDNTLCGKKKDTGSAHHTRICFSLFFSCYREMWRHLERNYRYARNERDIAFHDVYLSKLLSSRNEISRCFRVTFPVNKMVTVNGSYIITSATFLCHCFINL